MAGVCALALLPLACNLLVGNHDLSASDGGADATVDQVGIDVIGSADRRPEAMGTLPDASTDADSSTLDAAGDADVDAGVSCPIGSGVQGRPNFCELVSGSASDSGNYICDDFDTDASLLSRWSHLTRFYDAGTVLPSSAFSVSPTRSLMAKSPMDANVGWGDFVQKDLGAASSATLGFDLYIERQSTSTQDFANVATVGFGPATIDGGNPHVGVTLSGGDLQVVVYNALNHMMTQTVLTKLSEGQWYHVAMKVQLGAEAGANLAVVECPTSPPAVSASLLDAGFPQTALGGFFSVGLSYVASTTGELWEVYVDNVVFDAQ
jgi:hypothetical protein